VSEIRRLLTRAKRSFGDCPPDKVFGKVRAIVGSESAMPPTEEGRMAAGALEKLKRGAEPTAAELAALELLIRMTRPAPLVQGGKPADLPRHEHRESFPEWNLFQRAFAGRASIVGRIDRAGRMPGGECIGTCFQIDDERVLTNRHVLDQLSRGTRQLQPGMGVVRFQKEYDDFRRDAPVAITGLAGIHTRLDAAMLCIEKRPDVKVFEWRKKPPRQDTDVVVVGYPAEDKYNNPLFIEQIFQNRYEVLRAAPGMVVETATARFQHDASTLQGNSGSPVLELRTARVIGLHVGGAFLWSNEAVGGKTLAEFAGI
jgi:S1-C subfamily serine protease